MTLLERCQLAKEKGMTYNRETGKVYGVRGNEIIYKNNKGYMVLFIHQNKQRYSLKAHHFAWYMSYGNVNFEMLDHFNQDKSDNRVDNLRIANNQINQHNRLKTTKGYYFNKEHNRWRAEIRLNNKTMLLGYYKTEEEARQSYLNGKEKYHHCYCDVFD
jgi:hypothetical protein